MRRIWHASFIYMCETVVGKSEFGYNWNRVHRNRCDKIRTCLWHCTWHWTMTLNEPTPYTNFSKTLTFSNLTWTCIQSTKTEIQKIKCNWESPFWSCTFACLFHCTTSAHIILFGNVASARDNGDLEKKKKAER